jgi:hypothetical protein
LEAVTRYFGLKRLSRILTQADRDHKAPERQKCAICYRWHQGECRGKDSNPNWITNTEEQPEKVAELPTKESSKGYYTVRSTTDDITSIWWIDSAATYTVTNDKAWFTRHKASEPEPIQIGNNTELSAIAKGTVKLPNGIALQDVRYVFTFATNIIALADLRPYQPKYDWKKEEWLLRIGNIMMRIAKENRL